MPNTDPNAGTVIQPDEAQQPAAGTPQAPDEVTTLRSRNAGLDAKVTSLSQALRAAEEARAAAEARALELAEGKANGDQELRAQLEAERATAAQAKAEARKERLSRQFPETLGVLGDAALNLSEDQLAAAEARFAGAGVENPTPRGTNPLRDLSSGPKAIEDMTAAELRKHMASFDPSVMLAHD